MARSLVELVLFVLVLDLVLADIVNVGFSPADLESDDSVSALFDAWCKQHGKRYGNEDERLLRLEIFKKKLVQIQAHNSQQHSYYLGLNKFSDKTQEEMEAELGGSTRIRKEDTVKKVNGLGVADIPTSLDWRRKGAVTRVKDVGTACRGATWTYATTGAVEGKLKIDGSSLRELSAQQLLDCVDEQHKCISVPPGVALDYVKENGLTLESLYPFTGTVGTCKPPQSSLVVISGVEQLYSSSDDTDLLNAVAKQPVAVMVDGSATEFINYAGGIYSGPFTPYAISVSLLVIGYGTERGVPYWTAKNSWGMAWGEGGYIRIKRNGGEPYGILNINAFPTFPTGAGPGSRPPPCGASQKCPSGMTCCCREPAIGVSCTLYMCCPDKYSDCKNGCCNKKTSLNEMVFTTENQTRFY